jgi:hypothetical protein
LLRVIEMLCPTDGTPAAVAVTYAPLIALQSVPE